MRGPRATLYEVRADLVEALRDMKVDLARYRDYRDDPSWYVIDEGWGVVDLERLTGFGDTLPAWCSDTTASE